MHGRECTPAGQRGGAAFNDSAWATIAAGKTWEAQGYKGYDGYAWYRRKVSIPAAWSGAPITFVASGVDDEYDLFVDGKKVAHHGDKKVCPGDSTLAVPGR